MKLLLRIRSRDHPGVRDALPSLTFRRAAIADSSVYKRAGVKSPPQLLRGVTSPNDKRAATLHSQVVLDFARHSHVFADGPAKTHP
jgi:hypothetical protein